MSETVSLGEIDPARSRHAGRRSAVTLTADSITVGTATGAVRAFDRHTLEPTWTAESDSDGTAVVSAETVGDCLVVGERGPAGLIRAYDLETGTPRWQYRTADDLGNPRKETRFFLPFVVDIEASGERFYVAARRYERDDGARSFESVVYAFDPDGEVIWRYETDASPISLDVQDSRVAVAYNRCPGEHQQGLVVLDSVTGTEQFAWDPGTDGQRRVGDVSLFDAAVVVSSHGDYRGYRLDSDGTVDWCVDLATPQETGGETLYAYPNHVAANEDAVAFITGNTYAVERRETDSLHPDEHTVFGYTLSGERRWTDHIGGFASGVERDGNRLAIPSAQHFRQRDPDLHGFSVFDIRTGERTLSETDGVVTVTALVDETAAAIEEPVSYHDDGQTRGTYRLHVDSGL
ncbi:MAG: PQQ-binding-like beta-propeller repeat protein [Halovenus sp.]